MFCKEVGSRYEVVALDKSVSQILVKTLEKLTTPKERQKALDLFAAERNITGDDLSDLIYDLERAGYLNLTKPAPMPKIDRKKYPHPTFFKNRVVFFTVDFNPRGASDSDVEDAVWDDGSPLTDQELKDLTLEIHDSGQLDELWREDRSENP